MKLKRWHLYVVVTLCFALTFVTINKKYDPFYRVNGINNDNRALIELYLDENEQQYLIDNAIAMDKFIKYIASPNFYLPYYEYYNVLDGAKIFGDIDTLVDSSNTIAARLSATRGQQALQGCKELISNNLVLAFINQETFAMDNIAYYQQIRTLYEDVDYHYISVANEYISLLTQSGITKEEQMYDIIKTACDNYDKDSLSLLFTTPINEGVERIYNPSKLGQVINTTTYIASYEPKAVTIVSIPRTSYSMYLQSDANEALSTMYAALSENCGKGLILTRGARSYEMLSLQETDAYMIPGYNEFQLGTTVMLQQEGISSEDFITTDMYQWLVTNSYKYGYILRYPEGKEEITGHPFSSVTYRYVGEKLAKELFEQGLTLEEYQTIHK